MIERDSDPWIDAENLAAEIERLRIELKAAQTGMGI